MSIIQVTRWNSEPSEARHNPPRFDKPVIAAEGMDATWRDQMKANGEARTQAFARRLIAADYHGLMVRSFAAGAAENDLDLVLWRWGAPAPSRLTLMDDENRLSR